MQYPAPALDITFSNFDNFTLKEHLIIIPFHYFIIAPMKWDIFSGKNV